MYERLAPFYDLFDANDADALQHRDFVLQYARAMTHVLDVGAGTGLVAFHLARHGVLVWAVEPSAGMRGIMLARLAFDATLDQRLTILPSDAQTVRLKRPFPLAIACHTLYHISDDRLDSALSNVRAHLEPNALFIGDLALSARRTNRQRAEVAQRRIGEVTYRHFSSTQQMDAHRWSITWAFEAMRGDDALEAVEETFIIHTRTAEECRAVLQRNGFAIERECANYGGLPFVDEATADRFVFVARKH